MDEPDEFKKATSLFIQYLLTQQSQSKIAFESNMTREYLRRLAKGKHAVSMRSLCTIIEASDIKLTEGMMTFLELLVKSREQIAADRKAGKEYIVKNKSRLNKQKTTATKNSKTSSKSTTKQTFKDQ